MTTFHHPKTTAGWSPPNNIQTYAKRFRALISQPPDKHFWDATNDWFAQCWMWVGSTRKDGQAFMSCHGVAIPVHRFAWLLWLGDVPVGKFARPTACGVKLCAAPHHMELTDRRRHGRCLVDDEKRTIRFLREDPDNAGSGWSICRLATKFGVSSTTIRRVLSA